MLDTLARPIPAALGSRVRAATEKKSGKNGGARPGAGRPKGRKNSRTLEIEAAAQKYAGKALLALFTVATESDSDSARVAAATALLDRGYGRPRQAVEHNGNPDNPIAVRVTHVVVDAD